MTSLPTFRSQQVMHRKLESFMNYILVSFFTLFHAINSPLQFTQSSPPKNLLETVPPGTDVVQFTANQGNVEYYVTKVTSLGQVQPGLFKMSSELGQMKTAMRLDRDQGFVKYTVEVYVRDKGPGGPRTDKADVSLCIFSPTSFVLPM